MENVIGFGEVAIAIFMSFAVALTVQWIGLVALMRLMPAREAGLEMAKVAGQGVQRKAAELSLVPRERKNAA